LPREHEVCGFDELSHDGDDGDLGRFSGVAQALGEGFEARVEALGGDGGQVEHVARASPSAADEGLALPLSRLSIEGRYAEQGGGLPAPEVSQFGHADQQAGDCQEFRVKAGRLNMFRRRLG
jgi:hypothetical protein